MDDPESTDDDQPCSSRNMLARKKVKRKNDESFLSQSQTPTNRTINTSQVSVVEEVDKRELVKDVVQYLMATCPKKGAVRDAELTPFFSKAGRGGTREMVMEKVGKGLKSVFGIELHRDEEGKRYYLTTDLKWVGLFNEAETDEGQEDEGKTKEENIKKGVLISALMFIFMSKRHVDTIETEQGINLNLLKNFLNNVHQIPDKQFSSWFGPTKTAEFIAQGWLAYDQVRNDDSEQFFYHWGARAETIIVKKDLLESFCKIYGTQPKDWPNHARIAGIKIPGN